MPVWKPVFLHEFLDSNLANLRGIPGELTVLPGWPTERPPVNLGFRVSPGHSIGYQFDDAANDVIGIDLSVDFLLPFQPLVAEQTLVSLGGGTVTLSMKHAASHDVEFPPGQHIELAVGGQLMRFDEFQFPRERTTGFRVRWHTHGQAQIWHEGRLLAYESGLAAGQSFAIGGLVVGGPPGAPPLPFPGFFARRVYLKVLRKNDARDALDPLVPIDTSLLPRTPCATEVRAIQARMLARMRPFMAGTVSKLTTSWREGQQHSPFSQESIAAHAASTAAAEFFVAYLATRDQVAADGFLARIGEFLDILAAADPPGYAALLTELEGLTATLEAPCRAELEPLFAANAQILEPIMLLLQATWDRAKAAGGPDA